MNKTPLFYKSNRIIGASAPSQYLARLLKENCVSSSDQQDEIIKSPGIDLSMLKSDDFTAFYAARREALLQLIEKAMGKAAFRGEAMKAEVAAPTLDDNDEVQEDDILEDTSALVA